MINREFLKAGHLPTLLSAFFYFDMSFMVWVMLGPLAVQISQDLNLNAAQKGFMVALPVLAGALLRVVNGILVDHLKPRRAGLIGQVVVIVGLVAAWLAGITTYTGTLWLGVILGVAGASFAVALPLASRWYPPQFQGTALGIAGAGNSGTVFAALLAPGLAAWIGWQNVIGLAAIPLVVAFVVYLLAARDSPSAPPPKTWKEYLDVLKVSDAWWFMFFYAVTFGGFVGLASSLSIYFNTEYGLNAVHAGYFTAGCVFAGSLVRPIGGALADRIGGIRALSIMYGIVAVVLIMRQLPARKRRRSARAHGRRHAGLRHGQRFGLPARATAFPSRDRRDDRPRRHDGWHRWVSISPRAWDFPSSRPAVTRPVCCCSRRWPSWR